MNALKYCAVAVLAVATLGGCGGSDGAETEVMEVNGAALRYSDNRADGVPVVFLHGAVTDLRMWSTHRAIVGSQFRTVAYSQRYHGPGEWSKDWPAFGVQTHSDDLVTFLQKLKAGPVHLVAWSYAGHIAFDAALRHPELFRSVYVYEPGVPSYVTDPAELAANRADAVAAFGPIFEAVQTGDNVLALKRLLDASGQKKDYMQTQSPASQAIQLDNARTMPELLLRQAPAPTISCAQLRGLRMPVRVAYGGLTRPLYSVVGKAAQGCINGQHAVIAGQTHMWPDEDPAGFTQAALNFIKEH